MIVSFALLVTISASVAVARWSAASGDSYPLLVQCAVKVLNASKNLTTTATAVFVSTSAEVTDDFRSELLLAVHRSNHPALLLHGFDVKPFNQHRYTRPQAYLVVARGVSDLAGHLDTINVTAESWRPESNFVVVLQETVKAQASMEPIVQRLWTKFMLNSVLLVPSSAAVNVFVWYPFRENCGRSQLTMIGTCESGAAGGKWNASDAFDEKIPDVFPSCTVTVAGFYWPPMTVLTNETPRTMSYGMDVETVRLMSRVGNVDLLFREVAHNQRWGVKSPNGSWNGGFGELSAHRADLLIGGGILTAERLEMYDGVPSLEVIQFPIYTALPMRLPYWLNMLNVFSASFWLTLFTAFLLTSGLVWLSGARLPSERPAFADCGYCLVVAWAVLCSVAAGRQPTSVSSKLIFLSWTVYVLHISAVYTSMQLIYLYRPKYEQPMRTIDDVKRSGLTVCAVPTFIPIAHSMDPENFNLTDYIPCTDIAASTSRLLWKKDITILDPEDHFEALVPGSLQKVHKVEEMVIVYNIGIFIQKGNPYKAILMKAQSYAYEMGLHNKWRKDALPPKQVKNERQVKVKKLNIDELQGAFIILICGLSVSVAVFVIEWLSKSN